MRKILFGAVLFVVWLVTSVVFGVAFLAVKDALGWNVFSTTGYHAFGRCLVLESKKALQEKKILSIQKQ